MTIPEETLPSEGPVPAEGENSSQQEYSPEEPILPEGFAPLPAESTAPRRERRRRSRRGLTPLQPTEHAALLEELARHSFPSVEFFLFALLCGTILGAAYLLDAPALLLLGILLAPMLTPWAGMTLATVTGSWRFFFQTLFSLLIAGLLVILTSGLAGLVGNLWGARLLFYANIHSRLWWPDLLITSLGAILLVLSLVRLEQKPFLPNILLAYGFFLPLSAAGIGLGSLNTTLWSNGAQVFLVHLALATTVGGVTLAILRFRPARASGCLLPIFSGLAVLAALVFLTGLLPVAGLTAFLRTKVTSTGYQPPTATVFPSATFTITPTFTSTFTATMAPTLTPSITPTPEPPPPVYAVINSPIGGGAIVRSEPGRDNPQIDSLINGLIVEVLPEVQEVNGELWAHIRLIDTQVEGWVLKGVLTISPYTPTPFRH